MKSKKLNILFAPLLSCFAMSNTAHANSEIISVIDTLNMSNVKYHKTSYDDLYYVQGWSKQTNSPASVFANEDGSAFYMGDIVYKVSEGVYQSLSASSKLRELKKERPITFIADNPTAELNVFTDYTCTYCVKFHENIVPILLSLGVTVNYYAFPRNGLVTMEAQQLSQAWCADNPQDAMDILKSGSQLSSAKPSLKNCNNDILQQYMSARVFGLTGTPAFITPDGAALEGYPLTDKGVQVKNIQELKNWLMMLGIEV
ncbi:DsbC family protein [Vibrio lentus]|uniref:DsbC family protein n=2 Tax=Vibrio TaxID=662 RepID=UPI001E51E34C|nr:DsbC family protein [Vibrio lentus]MCC4837985.1 DsbC family protein [Vibrio lentus]